MNRILFVGSPGAGKSTFAGRLVRLRSDAETEAFLATVSAASQVS